MPKIVAHNLRRRAQVSAGKYRGVQADRLDEARDDDRIRVDLPATAVPAGRTVLQVGALIVRGPERIAVVGPNGSGPAGPVPGPR